MTIAAMAVLGFMAYNSTMSLDITNHVTPSHPPVSTRCSTATDGLKLCATTPVVPEFDLPDSPKNEWTYCGNADGPCTVNAYINKEWVIVRLVRS